MAVGRGDAQTLIVLGASNSALAVASEKDLTITYEAATIATDTKSSTSISNEPHRVNCTCSVEALYVHTDAAQQRLITLMKANTQCYLELHRSNTTYATATATITNLTVVHTDGEAATFSAEFDVDGVFTNV